MIQHKTVSLNVTLQILTKLCKEGRVDGPHFARNKVTVGDKVFTVNSFKSITESPTTTKSRKLDLSDMPDMK